MHGASAASKAAVTLEGARSDAFGLLSGATKATPTHWPFSPPVRRTDRLASLAQELQELVLSYINDDQDALRHLAQTNRRWRAQIAPQLYGELDLINMVKKEGTMVAVHAARALPAILPHVNKIVIRAPESADVADDGTFSEDESEEHAAMLLRRQKEGLLSGLPVVLAAVKDTWAVVEIDLNYHEGSDEYGLVEEVVGSLGIALSAKVMSLTLPTTVFLSPAPLMNALAGSSLTCFKLEGFCIMSVDLLDTLALMPELVALEMTDCFSFVSSFAKRHLRMPKLKYLSYGSSIQTDDRCHGALRSLLARCSPTLIGLSLHGSGISTDCCAISTLCELDYIMLAGEWQDIESLTALRWCSANELRLESLGDASEADQRLTELSALLKDEAWWPNLERIGPSNRFSTRDNALVDQLTSTVTEEGSIWKSRQIRLTQARPSQRHMQRWDWTPEYLQS